MQRSLMLVDCQLDAQDLSNPYRADIGTPDDIIARLTAYEAAGVENLVFRFAGEPRELETQLAWFGRDVLPAFQ